MAHNTPLLVSWFAAMDSEKPDDVLGMITNDFRMSVLFSSDAGAAEFDGDADGLRGYLAQREKGVLTHFILRGETVLNTELVLGETRRGEEFEASFNATATLDPDTGRVRRLLICRTPRIGFSDEIG